MQKVVRTYPGDYNFTTEELNTYLNKGWRVVMCNSLLKMKQNGLIVIPYYCEVVMATTSCNDSYGPSILYLCDGQACGPNHICNECKHTSDITHAMNFEKIDSEYDDIYFEKE